jgi:hypothetical protein
MALLNPSGLIRARARIPRTGNIHVETDVGSHFGYSLMVAVLRLNSLDSGDLVRS